MNIKRILNKLNKISINNGDIPISCIITKNNKIIAKAYNNKYYNNDPLGHAEIIAIRKAAKKLKTPNLIECEMYVTLKPCEMCQKVISESRIKKVYYYLENNKIINNNTTYYKLPDNDEFKRDIVDFFKNKR